MMYYNNTQISHHVGVRLSVCVYLQERGHTVNVYRYDLGLLSCSPNKEQYCVNEVSELSLYLYHFPQSIQKLTGKMPA